jgi:uncharacterized protein YdhG (YjbR/CyaY superfamily)
MNKPVTSVDDYIQGQPEKVQRLLSQLRGLIARAAPKATEKISYQMPTFYLDGNLVHFAAFKEHIGFYPTPSAIVEFQEQLKAYKTSKGAVQFPMDQPLPASLITGMVKFRVAENTAKK